MTLEDFQNTRYGPNKPKSSCDCCGIATVPFALVEHADFGGFVCGHCITDKERTLLAENPVANMEEEWNLIKSQRNRILEQYAWTIQRGSPLNTACQKAFETLMKNLHKLTITYATPAEVIWPDIPTLEYGD